VCCRPALVDFAFPRIRLWFFFFLVVMILGFTRLGIFFFAVFPKIRMQINTHFDPFAPSFDFSAFSLNYLASDNNVHPLGLRCCGLFLLMTTAPPQRDPFRLPLVPPPPARCSFLPIRIFLCFFFFRRFIHPQCDPPLESRGLLSPHFTLFRVF